MVVNAAAPPTRFETGSAQNTPSMGGCQIIGRSSVSGTTIIIFLKREKNTACFGRSRAVNTVWPQNCKAINTNPKKYIWSAFVPTDISSPLSVNILMKI